MSTKTPALANSSNMAAARPGRSGTSLIVSQRLRLVERDFVDRQVFHPLQAADDFQASLAWRDGGAVGDGAAVGRSDRLVQIERGMHGPQRRQRFGSRRRAPRS